MQRPTLKLLIVIVLIGLGGMLEIAGLLDVQQLLGIANEYAQNWWLILILILAQAFLFTFALAGSLFLWIAAPIYSPVVATFILAAGGTLGGLGAYLFSRYLSEEWTAKIQRSRSYRLLHEQESFLTLFALRVFPGFPHSLVNYSAGILKARLNHFIAAAILGISIKSYVYARVIHAAAHGPSLDMLLDISVLGPLLLLSAMSAGGVYFMYRSSRKRD